MALKQGLGLDDYGGGFALNEGGGGGFALREGGSGGSVRGGGVALASGTSGAAPPALPSSFINYTGSPRDGRAIGATFEGAAGWLTSHITQLQGRGTITQADYDQTVGYYNELEAFVGRFPIEYVQRQWSSPHYQSAFQYRLAQLRQLIAPTQTAAPTPAPAGGTGGKGEKEPGGGRGGGGEEKPGETLADLFSRYFSPAMQAPGEADPRTVTTYTPANVGGGGSSRAGLLILVLGGLAVAGYFYFKKRKGAGDV